MVIFRFDAMASACSICLATSDPALAERQAQLAIGEVRRIETKYSRYRHDSVVGRLNAAAGTEWIDLDPETEALLHYADALYTSSDGLFDITSGVLRRVWDFKRPALPDTAALAAVLPLIGWPQVQRAPGRARLACAGMEIDFGGFGKEYAADRAASALQATGASGGYVNLGGDVRVFGPQADGAPWRIGIQHPREAGATIAQIDIAEGALATSGDYERYFDLDGQRYCHILDPRNGQPVRHFQSVSVMAPLAVAAGSLATVAMLRQSQGQAFLEESGQAWLLVGPDGAISSRGAALTSVPANTNQ